jgi:hypothetical protein
MPLTSPKYGTIAIDSAGELARLFFSKDMDKSTNGTAKDLDKVRAFNNYPGSTERMNMLIRALKQKRDKGVEIVFTAHEDIEKVYAKGSGMDKETPVAIKGWPDLPGRRAPDEFCRAADNVLHVRRVNGQPCWIARREPIGSGNEYWEVKDRFNGPAILNGILPGDYGKVKELVTKQNPECWQAPFIWILYGPFGIGKTRSLLTFPQPILLFDLDLGTKSLTATEIKNAHMEVNHSIDVENVNDYSKFMSLLLGAV